MLASFLPANRPAFDEALAQSLSALPDGNAEDAGVALGRAVGWYGGQTTGNDVAACRAG